MKNIEEFIKKVLEEDIGLGDVTTRHLIPREQRAKAEIVAKEDGTLCGIDEAAIAFKLRGALLTKKKHEGDPVKKGEVVATVRGPAHAILESERTALNFLMRMSGIATFAKRLSNVAKSVNPKVKVVETRKTTPGFRYFEKKAVKTGSGHTHRYNLSDMVMIKDNHLKLVDNIGEAIKRAKKSRKKIEVEVSNQDEAMEALLAGAEVIMLDNFIIAEAEESIKKLKYVKKNIEVEASGGINEDNIADYAATGVDVVSLGCLTHSVKSLDFSLKIVKK